MLCSPRYIDKCPLSTPEKLCIVATVSLGGILVFGFILALIFWGWIPALIAAGVFVAVLLVILWVVETNEGKKRQQAAEAERQAGEMARLQRHRAEQQGYRQQMIVLGEQSIARFESMPNYLSAAEEHLDQAEVDFTDGAFAPFWDSIETAAKALGHFDEGVRLIDNNSSRYTELIKKYEDTPPEFSLARQSVTKLGVGTATAKRMQAIVRKAQRDFQFATIYEQRKTNQILVAGFTNLAQALNDMTWRITTSIDDLASSVDGMTSTFNESMHAIHSRMGDIMKTTTQHHEELLKDASTRAAREKRALEMLDNIQRGRRPFP